MCRPANAKFAWATRFVHGTTPGLLLSLILWALWLTKRCMRCRALPKAQAVRAEKKQYSEVVPENWTLR